MDVLRPHRAAGRRRVIRLVLIALILLPDARLAAACEGDPAPEASVKAAFLYNFVKFADWSALLPSAPILMCVVGDEPVAEALVETVRGETVNGHGLKVERPEDSAGWPGCQLLFIADAEMRRTSISLDSLKGVPILTVSDGPGFSAGTGIIELFVERGRMRFAVNVDAAEHAGIRLSSRLLGLAKVVRSVHAP